jgi:polyhydroxybutyrate depolymerase
LKERDPARLRRGTPRAVLVGLTLALVALVTAGTVPSLRRVADVDLAQEAPTRRATAVPAAVTHGAGARTSLDHSRARRGVTSTVVPRPAALTPVTGTVSVGGVVRRYEVFAPSGPVSPVPALVVLHGRTASVAFEESRDGLIELAQEGKAIVVYPVGYLRSWNAGACCGPARVARVDDRSFVRAVVGRLAARHDVSSVFLVGYSNGGKMAYDVACSDPKLVGSFVAIAAVPVSVCPAGPPVSVLEMAGTLDPLLTYDDSRPHRVVNGFTMPSVLDAVAAWRRRDGCSGQVSTRTAGILRLETWSHCARGAVVQLGTYRGLGHAWPAGGAGTPSAAEVLWAFLTNPPATPAVPRQSSAPGLT